jgi:hypothetical protein
MITAICDRLNRIGAPTIAAPLVGGIVLGIDQDPAAKVTQLLFDDRGHPSVVVKVARRPSAEAALRAEHRALQDLCNHPPLGVESSLPRPLLLESVTGCLVLATTALPGGPMSVGYYRPGHARSPAAVRGDFELAGSWLAAFQQSTRRGRLLIGPGTLDDVVLPIFGRYRAVIGWSSWEESLLDRLAGVCEALSGVAVPLVAVHGDFAIGNLLVSDGRVSGVVDWELGRDVGHPFTDLVKFVSSYGSFLDRAIPTRSGTMPGHPGWAAAASRWGGDGAWPNRVGLLYAHFGTGWFPDLVREFLRQQLHRLGVPAESLALFLPLFVAEQAMVLENPRYRAGYRSVLHTLWRDAELRPARAPEPAR